jgi:UDP-N-acetylglucosamine 2-epimerase (non-hydrolysing)
MAPVIAAARERFGPDGSIVVHTGQHYDRAMSEVFFEELGVAAPDHMLGVGSGSHAVQTARVLERLEPVLRAEQPDVVLVPGDVNSTLAAALCAQRCEIPVGHVESGLRSFDRTMPEEVNRIVADHVSQYLFTHSPEAEDNLRAEGIDLDRAHFVGNTMIDTLVALEERIRAREAAAALGLEPGSYLLVTLHRPALVDGPALADAIAALGAVGEALPVLFPVHPRTRSMLAAEPPPSVRLVDPVGYLDFLSLEADAAAVLTDSGGIQEETTYLGIPCFTLRDNTERPVTVRAGTNTLLGLAPERIAEIPDLLSQRRATHPQPPEKWDGHAAERLAAVLADC